MSAQSVRGCHGCMTASRTSGAPNFASAPVSCTPTKSAPPLAAAGGRVPRSLTPPRPHDRARRLSQTSRRRPRCFWNNISKNCASYLDSLHRLKRPWLRRCACCGKALFRPDAALPNSWRRPAWRVPAALAPSVNAGSRVGVWGRVGQTMHIFDTSSKVRLEERRDADGLDAYVPRIMRGGELCDANVDRFLLDLPLNGVRSRHSLRA